VITSSLSTLKTAAYLITSEQVKEAHIGKENFRRDASLILTDAFLAAPPQQSHRRHLEHLGNRDELEARHAPKVPLDLGYGALADSVAEPGWLRGSVRVAREHSACRHARQA